MLSKSSFGIKIFCLLTALRRNEGGELFERIYNYILYRGVDEFIKIVVMTLVLQNFSIDTYT